MALAIPARNAAFAATIWFLWAHDRGFDDPNVLVSLREPLRVRVAPGVRIRAT